MIILAMVRSNLGHAASIDAMTHRLHAPLSCTQHFSGSHPGPTLRLHTSHWRRERGRWSPQTWHFGALAIDEQLAHWPEQPRSVAVEPTNLGLQGCRVTFILLIFHPSRPTIIEYAMDIRVHFSWCKNANSVRPLLSGRKSQSLPGRNSQSLHSRRFRMLKFKQSSWTSRRPNIGIRVLKRASKILTQDCWRQIAGRQPLAGTLYRPPGGGGYTKPRGKQKVGSRAR